MGTVQVANNAYSTLAGGINAVVTTLSVAAGHGARFPAVTTASGNYFYLTIINSSNTKEIVKVTNVSTDTFTMTRAQDGTTGTVFSSGDRVELRVTAGLLSELPTRAIVAADITDGVLTYAKMASASIASASEIWANTASNLIDTAGLWAAGAEITLSDAATITMDFGTGINFSVTLGGNRTLGVPSNAKPGQSGRIRVLQDGTGSRTLAYHANYDFASGTAPVLTTTASATDILYYDVISASRVLISAIKNIS